MAFDYIKTSCYKCYLVLDHRGLRKAPWLSRSPRSTVTHNSLHAFLQVGVAASRLQGGGLYFAPTDNDNPDDADFTYMKRLLVKVHDVQFINNSAAEGGGLWSLWPMNVTRCSFIGNIATRAVSLGFLAMGR